MNSRDLLLLYKGMPTKENGAGAIRRRNYARLPIDQVTGRLDPKNSAWLIAARTEASWNGLVTR